MSTPSKPECLIWIWLFKDCDCAHWWEQYGHLNGFSPVWHRTWGFMLLIRSVLYPQKQQTNLWELSGLCMAAQVFVWRTISSVHIGKVLLQYIQRKSEIQFKIFQRKSIQSNSKKKINPWKEKNEKKNKSRERWSYFMYVYKV